MDTLLGCLGPSLPRVADFARLSILVQDDAGGMFLPDLGSARSISTTKNGRELRYFLLVSFFIRRSSNVVFRGVSRSKDRFGRCVGRGLDWFRYSVRFGVSEGRFHVLCVFGLHEEASGNIANERLERSGGYIAGKDIPSPQYALLISGTHLAVHITSPSNESISALTCNLRPSALSSFVLMTTN